MVNKSLLEACRTALQRHPPLLTEGGTLRIQTLFSRPRLLRSLFPLAHIHASDPSLSPEASVPVWQEHVVVTAAWTAKDTEEKLIYAMELYVYTLPQQEAALVYVSKLDTTGYGPRPLPSTVREHLPDEQRHIPTLTTILTSTCIDHFASRAHWDASTPVSHVSVHVLARAQGAYLFPSSPNCAQKRVLSDSALIRWWRACLSDVVLRRRNARDTRVDAHYLIPGYQRLDSHAIVPLTSSATHPEVAKAQWKYGHPYSERGASVSSKDELPPLPLHAQKWETRFENMPHTDALDQRVIPTLLPVFPDDPKGRFFNELCGTAYEPGSLFTVTSTTVKPSLAHRGAMAERHALEKLSIDGFWERMGFRQECCSGNAVGVFVVGCTATSSSASTSSPSNNAPTAQTYALPHPILEETVLKYMLQDACVWSDDTEAIKLTRQWNQAIEKVLQRKGGAKPESQSLVGQDVVWTTISLERVPSDVVDAASVRAQQAVPAARGEEAPAVRVLAVKRRKRS
ncbi:histone H3K56 acetyltransferase protein [Malassezia pachydermatis]|uniref:histone acetyltransferase n=1 Tax=Malassezia pachydermatis TaxID=77020 RepID=A0A0M8MS36_9BASI|nr:hypothetical protein Malapachy_0380 [Malassezia pachydermatis]KOS12660.1 hypothetical protein Malapachy_0380 [Malassezia pachydermatis]